MWGIIAQNIQNIPKPLAREILDHQSGHKMVQSEAFPELISLQGLKGLVHCWPRAMLRLETCSDPGRSVRRPARFADLVLSKISFPSHICVSFPEWSALGTPTDSLGQEQLSYFSLRKPKLIHGLVSCCFITLR